MYRPCLESFILRETKGVFGTALIAISLMGARPQAPTYTKDIAPLLAERCGMCHVAGGSAPFSLLTYADAKSHAHEIAAVTRARYMPPWKADPENGPFVGQHPLTDEEIDRIQQWVAGGAIEGEAGDVRVARPSAYRSNGWRLGRPDLIVTLPQPYSLEAEGTDVFRIFVLPVPITKARFVRGLEFRPGNSRVVHHANIRLDNTPASRGLDQADAGPGYSGLITR